MCVCMCVFRRVYAKVRIKINNIGTKIFSKKLSMYEYRICVYLGKHMRIYGYLDSNIHVNIEMANMEIM